MAAAGIGFTSFGQAGSEYSALLKANIEALAQLETWRDCGNDVDMAPNKMIDTQELTTDVKADSSGDLHIAGEKVGAGYEAEKTYEVMYQKKNCKESEGACCNQDNVGITFVSATKK